MRKDLIVLTACKDSEHALRGILSRPPALGIRKIDVDYLQHPNRDPGCLKTPEIILRGQQNRYEKALVIFDREGSGENEPGAGEALAKKVETKLSASGWNERVQVVVLEPELEIWVWSDSQEVDAVLGWSGAEPSLRNWLSQSGFIPEGGTKPARPKEAMEEALRKVQMPWSSKLFEQLGARVSFRRCQDENFAKLVRILQTWFPSHSE